MEPATVVLLLLLAACASAGYLAWRSARRAAEARAAADAEQRRRLEERLEEATRDRERMQSDLERRAEELEERRAETQAELDGQKELLEQEEERRSRAERSRRIEHGWNQELRARLSELHAERGSMGDTSDVRALVLRTAITLLDAEQGLLLSRTDADTDGDLDLVCAQGFTHDPEESAIAQHFARQVIARDETVRAAHPADLDLVGLTAADDEIDNLVAIPLYLRDRFAGVVVCANKPGGFTEYDDDILLALGDHASAALQTARLRGDVRSSYLATVRVLAEAIDAQDSTLRGHSNEVSALVANVADRIGLEPRRREELVFASLLHDVGKLGISERILLKPAALSPEERSIVELHPRIGCRLVEQVPALRDIAPAVLSHHERWDGDGYPDRLQGESIPIEARVVAVADAFSAMTSDRPHRERMSVDEACDELRRCAGTQFDPAVARLFVEEIKRRPPVEKTTALTSVLAAPEFSSRRYGNEPLLGFNAFSAIDNLTLLYSHRHLHELAGAETHRAELQGRPFAVVVLELAGLVELNREKGYAAGDDAIRALADEVQRVAGRCGGTAARLSGRRIALVVPGADESIGDQLAQEILRELGNEHDVRSSVAAWHKGDSGEDVLERARARLAPHAETVPST